MSSRDPVWQKAYLRIVMTLAKSKWAPRSTIYLECDSNLEKALRLEDAMVNVGLIRATSETITITEKGLLLAARLEKAAAQLLAEDEAALKTAKPKRQPRKYGLFTKADRNQRRWERVEEYGSGNKEEMVRRCQNYLINASLGGVPVALRPLKA